MGTYKVWLDGQQIQTATLVEAQSSFSARQWLATQYGVKALKIIAVKQHRNTIPGEAVNLASPAARAGA